MAYNNRTPNRPPARRNFPQDDSQNSRFDQSGFPGYGSEEASEGVGGYPQGGLSQYSRYSANSYTARGGSNRPERNGNQRRGAAQASQPEWDDATLEDDLSYEDESSRYGRDSSRSRYAAQSRRRKRGAKIRAVIIAVIAVVLLGVGSAFAYMGVINGNLSAGLDSKLKNTLVKTNLTKEPFYMLLLGTDASLERENDETYGEAFRTDTILFTRVDPVEKKITMISMPRDTMVQIPGHGTQKLNAAYAFGGASGAVETVSDIAGVGISHFCLVDMDGLVSVVDALGGVEVDVPIEINDEDAGGHLDAGLQTLNGEQALILCRSRNAFEDFGGGDIYRAANQRLVLQAIAKKVLESDIGTIANTVTAFSEFVSTDLSVNDIVGLAQAFQGLDTENSIYTGSLPTESQYIDDLWYEVIIEDEWEAMMKRVDQGLPPSENTVTDERIGLVLSNSGGESGEPEAAGKVTKEGKVVVRNGTMVDGAGSAASNKLMAAGFSVSDVAGADTTDYTQTTVVYEDDAFAEEAAEIAEVLGPTATAVKNDGTYTLKGDFLVVVGSDLAESLVSSSSNDVYVGGTEEASADGEEVDGYYAEDTTYTENGEYTEGAAYSDDGTVYYEESAEYY